MNGWDTDGSAGVFRAVSVRDSEALRRDGERFYDSRPVKTSAVHEDMYEVQFGDGQWMLAALIDLDLVLD